LSLRRQYYQGDYSKDKKKPQRNKTVKLERRIAGSAAGSVKSADSAEQKS